MRPTRTSLGLPEWVTVAMWTNWKKTDQRVDCLEERLAALEELLACPSFPPEETKS